MHFWAVAARTYERLSKPRKTSLNWFIPAFVNSSVGSSPGTTGLEATTVWPFDSKNLRKLERMSAALIGMVGSRRLGPARGAGESAMVGGGVRGGPRGGTRSDFVVGGDAQLAGRVLH